MGPNTPSRGEWILCGCRQRHFQPAPAVPGLRRPPLAQPQPTHTPAIRCIRSEAPKTTDGRKNQESTANSIQTNQRAKRASTVQIQWLSSDLTHRSLLKIADASGAASRRQRHIALRLPSGEGGKVSANVATSTAEDELLMSEIPLGQTADRRKAVSPFHRNESGLQNTDDRDPSHSRSHIALFEHSARHGRAVMEPTAIQCVLMASSMDS
jgi:hypothetical protein